VTKTLDFVYKEGEGPEKEKELENALEEKEKEFKELKDQLAEVESNGNLTDEEEGEGEVSVDSVDKKIMLIM